jgi:diaminopimelate decarboxylase
MTCDGSDVVANNLSVPEMEVGDWIIIGGMGKIFYLGAYTVGPASEFNGMKALSKVVIWE